MTDYHVHTPLCRHATGEPEEYVAAAQRIGLDEIGFADHNPMPEPFDNWRMLIEELPRYIEMIERARSGGIMVRLGLECDYIAGQEQWIEELAGKADWDYLIGSVHYIAPGWDVDNPKHLSRFSTNSVADIWDLYWKQYVRCIESGLFDFVGHPDLPKKFGYRPNGDLKRYYEPAVRAMAQHNVAFEINTAGLRKPAGEVYPELEFIRLAHEAGVAMLINSDAHTPDEVGYEFDSARALARAAGYTTTARLERRKRIEVAL